MSAGLVLRCAVGGVLMGLANLVPGISGGTMLLAAGVYPEFVNSVAAITTLRRQLRPWLIVAFVAVPAVLAIGLLAGTVRDTVLVHRWIAYSLFIGLTLGGVPLLWRMIRPLRLNAFIGCAIALILMIALVMMQQNSPAATEGGGGVAGLFIAAFIGSTAMVLPGVSGGYLLLLMGQYVAVLDAISTFTESLRSGDVSLIASAAVPILAIGVGFALGVVVISNLMRWLLRRHEQTTLGCLLGLLVGAVFGLWPFREAVAPNPGDVIRGVVVETPEAALDIPLKYWPTEHFTPGIGQILISVALVVLGFGICWGIGLIGRDEPSTETEGS